MTSVHPPETVRAYLDELRRALKGAPAGLISDALADTEDHLNNEIATQPGSSGIRNPGDRDRHLRHAARNRRGV